MLIPTRDINSLGRWWEHPASARCVRAFVTRIPKCGTIWTEAALSHHGILAQPATVQPMFCYGPRHRPAWAVTESWSMAFALVRHPVSWYESWFRFQRGKWPHFAGLAPSHPQRVLDGLGHDDFNTWVARVLEREPAYVTRMYEWFLGPPDAPIVTRVGRLETASVDMAEFLTLLGYDASIEKLDNIGSLHASEEHPVEWDPELRRRVEEIEAAAIRRFYDP